MLRRMPAAACTRAPTWAPVPAFNWCACRSHRPHSSAFRQTGSPVQPRNARGPWPRSVRCRDSPRASERFCHLPSDWPSLLNAKPYTLRAQVPADEEFDWAARYQPALRALPLAAGGAGLIGALLNRLLSGIAPVVDASSAQSRADVVVIFMSAVLLLTGLQWAALTAREAVPVEPDGPEVGFYDEALPEAAVAELKWAWSAMRAATRCRALVAFRDGRCIAHAGVARRGLAAGSQTPGPFVTAKQESGSGSYLANMVLYPSRFEFFQYLPDNIQGVAIQPIGDAGVLVAATDTVRGFSALDQAWLAAIADKLDATLEGAGEGCGDRPAPAVAAAAGKTSQ